MAKTAAYRTTAPTVAEVVGACETCLDGIAIIAARGEGWYYVKCLNCGTTHSVADTESGVATEPVSSSVPGGGGQTSGLPGGPALTTPSTVL